MFKYLEASLLRLAFFLERNDPFHIYLYMLEFKQDDIAASLILTLTELVSIPDPYFLFVFTHVSTKNTVIFLKASSDDESNHPERYNQFTIDPSVVFVGQPPGEWHYQVQEQSSPSNLDPTLSGWAIEYGKMILLRAIDFDYTKYNSPTSYIVYNG